MDKHTPGPWTLQTVPTQVGSCHKIGPFPGPDNRPESYACVYADHIYPGDAERGHHRGVELLANARLITAAPELLEALKSEHRSEFEGRNGCVNGPRCATCTLIAKAEGRSE